MGYIKPSSEIFSHALIQLASTPSETIFIDDNEQYVMGARAVGLRGLLFTTAQQLIDDLRQEGVTF